METPISLSTLHVAGDAYVCCVSGDLHEPGADAFRLALDGIHARGGRRVIVDLCGVHVLDTTVLDLLLLNAERLRVAGGALTVVADHPRILQLIEDTGAQFRLERTLSEAVNGVAAGLAS